MLNAAPVTTATAAVTTAARRTAVRAQEKTHPLQPASKQPFWFIVFHASLAFEQCWAAGNEGTHSAAQEEAGEEGGLLAGGVCPRRRRGEREGPGDE